MKRDFAALLDEIMREEAEAVPSTPQGVDYLAVLDELAGSLHIADEEAVASYRDSAQVEKAFTPDLEVVAMDTDPAAVERELDLVNAKSVQELDQRRRTFALDNHPDRVRPEYRQIAVQRMQIANMLIDEAKRMRMGSARVS